jgi:drug/metabolite transporter (DMT)-like permease
MPITSWQLIYMQGIFAVAMLTPLWLTSDNLLPTESAIPLIMYASIAASILAPWMWVKAIDVIGAESSAMFMNLLPVVAVSLAAMLLGEKIESYHLMGGLMVISGVILAQVKTKKAKQEANLLIKA